MINSNGHQIYNTFLGPNIKQWNPPGRHFRSMSIVFVQERGGPKIERLVIMLFHVWQA